jgi:transcriptional regulator with XRE-family HTH domain
MSTVRRDWERSGLTQKEFAKAAGVSLSTIKRYMKKPSSQVSRAFRRRSADIAYSATHSRRQVERRAERLAQTERYRAEYQAAKADTSPLTWHRLKDGGTETVTGRMAGDIRAAYVKANRNRTRLGYEPLKLGGYYGSPEKLLPALRHKQTLKALKANKSRARNGFIKSVLVGLERGGVDTDTLDAAESMLRGMGGQEIDALYQQTLREDWDVIRSPVDPDTKQPIAPDVTGLLDYLGLKRTTLDIRL